MKNKVRLTIVCFALCLSGCMNLIVRPVSDYNNGPYYCTSRMNRLIEKSWNGSKTANVFVLPLCLDWPFDALTDTVMLPWDCFMYNRRYR